MRLLTFSEGGKRRLGALAGGRVVDLAASFRRMSSQAPSLAGALSDMRSFLAAGDAAMDAARQVVGWAGGSGDAVSHDQGAIRIGAPISDPSKVICVGKVDELLCLSCGIAPSPLCDLTQLTAFSKFPECLIGDGDAIVRPQAWPIQAEGELALIIGREGKHIAQEMAFDHVAGYAPMIDVSTRGQGEESHPFLHKCLDASGALGPFLVTPDEVDAPPSLEVTMAVNDVVRQRSNTSSLDFEIPYIISSLSHFMTLMPGDVIACGMLADRRPSSGPVELSSGDRVSLEIEGLGRISNPVAGEGQRAEAKGEAKCDS